MIIYKDIVSGDEVISDVYGIKDVGNGLWEVDGKMIKKGGENFVLEGANASAEGEDADEGGEGETVQVIDFVDSFQLVSVDKPSKKVFTSDMKKFLKGTMEKLKEKGESEDQIKKFQTDAQAAIKKILGNFDNYDMFLGPSMTEGAMPVLVDYREDGVTPYATLWGKALVEEKV